MNADGLDLIPPDPLVDEVRAVRQAISDRFENDVDRLCDFLEELPGELSSAEREKLLREWQEGIPR